MAKHFAGLALLSAAIAGCQAKVPVSSQVTDAPVAVTAADPLADKLQSAYSADATTAHKLIRARQLAGAYRYAAVALAQNPETITLDQLHAQLVQVIKVVVPDDALQSVRQAIADDTAVRLGTDPNAKIDTQSARDAASNQFARVAKILEVIR